MSFPRYPSHVDSGVDWLGKVPAHWTRRRLGYFFRERRETVNDKDFPPLSVTKDGIVPQLETAAKSDDSDNRRKVCPGDFVINSRSDRKGSSGVSSIEGSVSLICTVLTADAKVCTSFVHYLLRSQPFQEEFYRNGRGIVADLWTTRFSDMRNILLAMPPLEEQSAIAHFLDMETAKIDALIAEQEHLIALLTEKRHAVISRAISEGLAPASANKPSGMDWPSHIPIHWGFMPLKRDLELVTSGSRGWAEHYSDNGPLFIRIANLTRNGIGLDWNDTQRVSISENAEGSRTLARPGDVLFSITAYLGSVAVVPDGLGETYVSQHVAIARLLANRLTPKWVAYVALSALGKNWCAVRSYGGTKIQFSLDDVREWPMPVPPLAEQEEIVALIERELARLDALAFEARSAITLLQERRLSLVSTVVTGQIDVRGHSSVQAS